MQIWDVGGQDKIRRLWRHYFQGTNALVFVVDSNDRERLDEARDELHRLAAEPELERVPILVYGNKADLPRAVSTSTLADQLKLRTLRQAWYVQQTSAMQGAGVYEGLDWLSDALRKKRADAA